MRDRRGPTAQTSAALNRRPRLLFLLLLLCTSLAAALVAAMVTEPQRANAAEVKSEAEAMVRSGSNVLVHSSASASGGKDVAFYSAGTASKGFSGSPTSISLRARQRACGSEPAKLRVYVDGVSKGTLGITATSFSNYTMPISGVTTGSHTLKVEFINDYQTSNCDRNAYLDYYTLALSPGLTYVGSATGNTGTTPQVKVTVPVPPGTKQGDFMLALLQAGYGNVGGTLPSGWKLIDEHLEGRDLSLHAYYKIAGATEPPSYTWNVVNADPTPLAGGTILTFRGVDQASPVFASIVNPETADPAKIDCPSVNAPSGGTLVCGFAHDDPQPDVKAPAGMTRVSNFILRNDDAHAVAYQPIAIAGATGTRSATIDANIAGGKNDISMAISLRPLG